jgi:hypothetical protein
VWWHGNVGVVAARYHLELEASGEARVSSCVVAMLGVHYGHEFALRAWPSPVRAWRGRHLRSFCLPPLKFSRRVAQTSGTVSFPPPNLPPAYYFALLGVFVLFRLPLLVERWMDVADRRRNR